MTEHSLEELVRQHTEAAARRRQAERVEQAAADRVCEARGRELLAKFAAMGGVVGKTRVREADWNGKPNMYRGPFIVIGIERDHDDAFYDLAKIKKDGTPSSALSGVWRVNKVVILPEDNA
jgi:hypothetical protein